MNYYYVLTFRDAKASGDFIHGMNPSIETHLAGKTIYAKMERRVPCTSIAVSYQKFGLTTAQQVTETEYNERMSSEP